MTIPSGWRSMSLSEVLDRLPSGTQVQQGWSPQCDRQAAEAHEWGVLKTTAIQPGLFLSEHNKRLPSNLQPRPSLEVRPGDLLLTNAGPRARCAIPCLVRATRPHLMLSGKVYRFRTRSQILDSRFLEWYLLSPAAQGDLDAMKTGISDSGLNLTRGKFLALAVPVPPVEEQRRIVEALEDHLSRLDEAAAAVRDAIRRAAAWRQAAIEMVVWGRQRDIALVPVADLLREKMRNGHSARASKNGDGIRALTLTAVTKGCFVERFTKMVEVDPRKVATLWLEPDDILVQRSNTPELVGTTAHYQGPREWAIFPDLLIRLRADESRVTPAYLAACMRTERAHRRLREQAQGLAGSMPKIDQAAIGSLRIPLPTLAQQRKATESVDQIEIVFARLTAELERSNARARSMRAALLEAAFSGRLDAHKSDDGRVEEFTGG
jgi:type I restriction enzyme S subunit